MNKVSDKTITLLNTIKSFNTDELTIEELKEKVKFQGSMPTFRTLCWRFNVSFKKRSITGKTNFDFSILETIKTEEKTLDEIKEAIGYKGSVNSLLKLLSARGYTHKRKVKKLSFRKDVLEAVKDIDTTKHTPQEIFNLIGLSTLNPASYLRAIGVQYKTR